MLQLLFLLLPVAAFSGYYFARKQFRLKSNQPSYRLPKEYLTGLNYLINEQPDKAVDIFLDMLDLDDELVETHLTLGALFRRRGEVDRAIRIHQGLIARPHLSHTQHTQALLELARDYISAGVLDRAENLLLELVALKEQLEPSLQHLVRIYQQGQEWDKAIQIGKQLQSITDQNLSHEIAHFYCEQAKKHWEQGAIETAQKALKKALEENHACVRASILQGDILTAKGEYQEAIRQYKRVPLQQPIFLSEVLSRLMHNYQQLGMGKAFLKYLQNYLSDPKTRSIILSDPKYVKAIDVNPEVLLDILASHAKEYPSIKGALQMLAFSTQKASGILEQELQFIRDIMRRAVEQRSAYRCESCGFSSQTLQWLCPGCKMWDKIKPVLAGVICEQD